MASNWSTNWSTLIAVGGTIGGAVVTGGFSLFRGRQERSGRELDISAQRHQRHLEIRRDAYANFIAKLATVDDAYTNLVNSKVIDIAMAIATANPISIYENSVKSARDSFDAVFIEGPESVANAGQDLVERMRGQCAFVVNYITGQTRLASVPRQSMMDIDSDFDSPWPREVADLKQRFMLSVRASL